MDKKLTPTLALIVAGGLAAGIGLARPGTTSAADAPAAADADQTAVANDETYRSGNRAGNRGGTPAAASDDGADAATGGQAETATVTIEGFQFDGPGTVAPGAALSISNLDGAAHTLTFRSGELDTGDLAGGATTTLNAPVAPGTYAFFCEIHPSMEGEVVVAG